MAYGILPQHRELFLEMRPYCFYVSLIGGYLLNTLYGWIQYPEWCFLLGFMLTKLLLANKLVKTISSLSGHSLCYGITKNGKENKPNKYISDLLRKMNCIRTQYIYCVWCYLITGTCSNRIL
jgi:hypothetical protein